MTIENHTHELYNSMTLPPPLTKEEEKELMKNFYKNREIFVERNLRLVAHICKKFAKNKEYFEEFFSVGCIGLLKASNTFNPEKGVKFISYASHCIENEILMYLRKLKKQNCVLSLETVLSTDIEGNELTLTDIITDSNNFEELYFDKNLISHIITICLNTFSLRENTIFLLSLSKKTQKEIAAILKLSQSYISRLYKKVLKKIHEIVDSENKISYIEKLSFILHDEIIEIVFYEKFYDNTLEKTLLKIRKRYNCGLIFSDDGRALVLILKDEIAFYILADILRSLN